LVTGERYAETRRTDPLFAIGFRSTDQSQGRTSVVALKHPRASAMTRRVVHGSAAPHHSAPFATEPPAIGSGEAVAPREAIRIRQGLTIRCFGRLALERAGRYLVFPTRRAKLLFAYLVLHRDRTCAREVVRGALWGDESEQTARKHMRTELWRLRRYLEPHGTPRGTFLRIDSDRTELNRSGPYWLDLDEFERRLRAAGSKPGRPLTAHEVRLLEEASELYRGDVCEDVDQDWAVHERERLVNLHRGTLERLMAHYAAQGDWDVAIGRGQRLLRSDPLLEHVHRELMRFHYAKGDRPAAIRQYQQCADILHRLLDVGPMPETLTLYEAIRNGHRPQGLPVREPRRRTGAPHPTSTGLVEPGPFRSQSPRSGPLQPFSKGGAKPVRRP